MFTETVLFMFDGLVWRVGRGAFFDTCY